MEIEEKTLLHGQQRSGAERLPARRRLLSSTFLLLTAMLIAFECGVRTANPLRYINDAGFTTIHYNFLVAKLPPLLNSPGNADVLLLGSSGVLVPSVRCDDAFHRRRTRYDQEYFRKVINAHCRADFLAHLLSNAAGKPVSVANAAVAGGVLSDDWLIAKRYLASGKHPRLAIICVAPREFYDNTRTDVEHTATAMILADYRSAPEVVASWKSPAAVMNDLAGMFSRFYEARGDYKAVVAACASRLTGHPVDLYTATHEQQKRASGVQPKPAAVAVADEHGSAEPAKGPLYEQPRNILADLSEYRQMYLPVNDAQFRTQSAYLIRLLDLFKQQHIPVLVVELPLTPENATLLPAPAHKRYEDFVARTCASSGVPLDVVPAHATFATQADFEDSVHMNRSGGDKLFRSIATAVAESPQLLNALR